MHTAYLPAQQEIKLDNENLVTTVKEARHRVSFLGYLKFFT